jgi:polyhydroxyalkanoate synthesis repressor PhaR
MTSESGQEQTESKEPKIIKRYSNRKLYDTERSKYVTLDEIAKMIKAGDEVTIIDNESKEDLTSVTLTQIIYEEEKRESRMPLSMLRNLIQTGGEALQDFFDKSVKTPALEAQKSVEKGVEELKRSVTGLTGSARRLLHERKAEEFRKSAASCLDQLQHLLETRVQEVSATRPKDGEAESEQDLASLGVDGHVEMLRGRLDAVGKLVDEMQKTVSSAPQPPSSEPR